MYFVVCIEAGSWFDGSRFQMEIWIQLHHMSDSSRLGSVSKGTINTEIMEKLLRYLYSIYLLQIPSPIWILLQQNLS